MPVPSGNSVSRVAGQPIIDRVWAGSDFLNGPAVSATVDIGVFHLSGASASVALADDELNGVATITSNSTTAATLILNGEPFHLAANRRIQFDARVNLTDHDGMSFFAGLAVTAASPTVASTDHIGFYTTDGTIRIACGKDATAVGSGDTNASAGVSFASDTWVVLSFVVNGTDSVDFYVDGSHVGRLSAGLPDNENLTIEVGTIGSAEVFDIDYAFVESPRDTAA